MGLSIAMSDMLRFPAFADDIDDFSIFRCFYRFRRLPQPSINLIGGRF